MSNRPSYFPRLSDPAIAAAFGNARSTSALAGMGLGRVWPLHPLGPVVVMVVSVAVALAIGFVGVDHLARASDDHAAARAELLAATVGARLTALTPNGRLEAVQLAARRTGAELLVVTPDGDVLDDASLGVPSRATLKKVVEGKHGEAITSLGRTRFAAHRVANGDRAEPDVAARDRAEPYVVCFVRAPSVPDGSPALVSALVALIALLVGVAATFAWALARDADVDVKFLTKRVRAMQKVHTEPSGEKVPVRALDEVGVLIASFNELVGRFVDAERAYHTDLARARSADRDRAAFLAAVSHELRSPLNAILGFADLLMAEVDGPLPPGAREEVEQVRASGAHLLELINDILEFSALEGGQLRLTRAAVDVTALAGEVLREAVGAVQGRPLVVRMEGAPRLVIEADAKRLRQILTNLVGNAVKFTQQGEVTVAIAQQGAYAKIAVRDTGPGISEDERAVIFEEYRQASEERTKRRGTGLGLAIARRLVLLHGGTIHVESELGRGSTFHVLLPIAPLPRSAAGSTEGQALPPSRASHLRTPYRMHPPAAGRPLSR